MTDFDKKLIQKANRFNRWDYRDIDVLIAIADTKEASLQLSRIQTDLYCMVEETV